MGSSGNGAMNSDSPALMGVGVGENDKHTREANYEGSSIK